MADDTQSGTLASPAQTTADDKMVFEPERLGYESAKQIAAAIAQELSDVDKAQPVVIASLAELADIANLRGTMVLIGLLRQDYGQIAQSARVA
jgi:hypothetical protein